LKVTDKLDGIYLVHLSSNGDSVSHNIVLWKCVRLYLFQMKNPQQTKRSHLCALFRPRTLS
jgi:hypothetical protein